MSAKLLLVTGATGKQGTALVSALRDDTTETNPFRILALTRNAASPEAKHLASEKHVDVVQGDLDDEVSLRTVFEDAKERGGVWGVFCVLAFPGLGANADGEEKQGKTLADLALEYGVSSFVFSSAERGGENFDDHWTLDRRAKVKIEQYVRELGTKGLNWTILRPGFFMENLEGAIGAITVGVLKVGLKPDTTIQLIAVEDIGYIASAVFKAPDRYSSRILVVVGDICTTQQIDDAYKAATGRKMASIPGFLARMIIRLNGHTQGLISDLERVHLVRADPHNEEIGIQNAAAKEAYPNMATVGAWAVRRQHNSRRRKNWNQVSIARLITGKL